MYYWIEIECCTELLETLVCSRGAYNAGTVPGSKPYEEGIELMVCVVSSLVPRPSAASFFSRIRDL